MKTILDYASSYSHKSYSVIPIVGKNKKPAIQSWKSNQSLFRRLHLGKGDFLKVHIQDTKLVLEKAEV